jgi:hypothetical protein
VLRVVPVRGEQTGTAIVAVAVRPPAAEIPDSEVGGGSEIGGGGGDPSLPPIPGRALAPPAAVGADGLLSFRERFAASLFSGEDELFVSSLGNLGMNRVDLVGSGSLEP